jgi:hypothetical protein
MFDLSNPDTLWLNLTNLLLGVTVAFCLGLTLIWAAVGLVARIRSRVSSWGWQLRSHNHLVFHAGGRPPLLYSRRILRRSNQ